MLGFNQDPLAPQVANLTTGPQILRQDGPSCRSTTFWVQLFSIKKKTDGELAPKIKTSGRGKTGATITTKVDE